MITGGPEFQKRIITALDLSENVSNAATILLELMLYEPVVLGSCSILKLNRWRYSTNIKVTYHISKTTKLLLLDSLLQESDRGADTSSRLKQLSHHGKFH